MKAVWTAIVLIAFGVTAIPAVATNLASRNGEEFTIKRGELSRQGQAYVQTIDMLFNARNGGRLILGTSVGSVSVETWSEDKVRLVVTKRTLAGNEDDALRIMDMFRIRALQGGNEVSFTGRARTRECAESVGVMYTIWVPRSYELDIKTDSGDIEIAQTAGKYSAHTGDGKITVDVDTDDLDIEVEDHTGDDAGVNQPTNATSKRRELY